MQIRCLPATPSRSYFIVSHNRFFLLSARMTKTTPSEESSKKSIWSDLPRRLATICIGFPLVWNMLSHPTSALVFFMGAHALSAREYCLLDPKQSTTASTIFWRKFGFCFVSCLLAHVSNDSLFHLLVCGMAGVFVWIHKYHWILGLLFITIPFRTWYHLSQDFASTISILLVVWNCDTGALLCGRLSSKLQNRRRRWRVPAWIHQISPAKSMEGFLGGILGGTWTAVSWIPVLQKWGWMDETTDSFDRLWTPLSHRVLLGVALSLLAIVGDLVESSIKRQSQSKDSGSVLPGHGGILDRFDSSLLAVLLYQYLLELIVSSVESQ